MRGIFLIVTIVMLSGCAGIATVVSCAVDPAAEDKPQLKHHEFPFHFEYEHVGKIYIVDDTLICDYKGRACDGRGMHNEWSERLTSGNADVQLLKFSENERLILAIGSCAELQKDNLQESKSSVVLERKEGASTRWTLVKAERLWKEFQIKVTNYHMSKMP